MASTRQEAETIERKLRPVYEAIDNSQHKKVIQLVEKILKKSPTLYCAKALKAIALLKLGRGEEGSKIINDVIDSCPGDSATLQAVYMYCRELGDYRKMVSLYERAVRNYPSNEEFLTQLFMAYVRIGDCQKQQQAAVQLSKQFPRSGPYHCWRIMSIVMQAHEAEEDTAKKMYLPLAERLMEKYIEEKRVESETEVRLYISVLQSLNKQEKILTVIRGDLGQKFRQPEEALAHELTALKSLQLWDELALKLSPVLSEQPDHWLHLQLYIKAQLGRELCSNIINGDKEEEGGEERKEVAPLSELCTFINNLVSVEREKVTKRLRGPFLAQLEILKQMKEAGISISDLPNTFSSPSILIQEYFKLFSSKHCCYDDLHRYLYILSKEERDECLVKLQEWCNTESVDFNCQEENVSKNVTNLYRDITLLKLQRYCGTQSSLSLEEKHLLVTKFYKLFESGLIFGRSLSSTVSQHSDFYVLIAAHLLIEIYRETGNYGDLWECVIMLESAHVQSPSNHHILLLLLKLYGWLGAVDQCTQVYNKLAIKHIQIDTLGYLILRYLQAMGAFGFAGQMFRASLRFYISCNKETSDYITTSYKNGIFHKIVEIINLRDKINRSYNFYSLGIDSMLQEYLKNVTSMEQARTFLLGDKYVETLPFALEDIEVLCDGLKDNRDLSICDDWSPPNCQLTNEEKVASFQLECLWIKVRLYMMESIKELMGVVATPTQEPKLEKLKQLQVLLQEIKGCQELIKLKEKPCLLLPIQAPPPGQLSTFVNDGFSVLCSHVVKIVLAVFSSPSPPLPSSLSTDITGAKDSLQGILDGIKGLQTEDGHKTYQSILNSKIDLEKYVMSILVASWVTVLCGACLQKLPGKKTGKRKKKSATPIAPPKEDSNQEVCVSLIVDLLEGLKSSLLTMTTRFKTISEDQTLVKQLEELYISSPVENQLGMNKEKYCEMKTKVTTSTIESYNICFGDCKEMVELRIFFINTLLQTYRKTVNVVDGAKAIGGAAP